MLAVLFVVRLAMGFQFQTVAASAPQLAGQLGVGLADIGFLIGIYMSPGIVLALPGGAIGARFGDKRVALTGLALMAGGGLLMALVPAWPAQVAGRLLAGTGGVILNVLMSKMVQDWFAGREIATAMGLFVNSWPVGIALGLAILPGVASQVGAAGVQIAAAAYAVAGFLLLALAYRSPPTAAPVATAQRGNLGRDAGSIVMVAALMWSLYNVGFAVFFSFAPIFLAERGMPMVAAGQLTGLAVWLAAVSVAAGGWLADRTGRPHAILVAGCIATAAAIALAGASGGNAVWIALVGFAFGFPAGPIMSLAPRVLTPATRAVGMGLFFTVFYVGNAVGPSLAGYAAAKAGGAEAALAIGVACFLACPLLLMLFLALSRRLVPEVPRGA